MKKVVILGAGISGLALGWFLKERYGSEIDLTILEKDARAGGWIETIRKEGFLFESGPRGFRPKGPGLETLRLIENLGLQDQVIAADPAAHIRYIYRDQALQQVPSSFVGFLKSPLTKGLIFTLCREFFKGKHPKEDPSIHEFISYRFSQKVAEELMDPLNSGIYAGDIRKLSMRSCFPAIYNLEREYGSIVKGMLFKRKRKENVSPFIQSLSKESVVSFKNGMQTLTDTLAARLQNHIQLGCEVLSVKENHVQTTQGSFEADHIFSTLPAKSIARLFGTPGVTAASVAVVNFGYKQELPIPKGFGYLIPSKEKEKVLGMVWDSYVFPQQKQGDETRLTVMIGGTHLVDFQSYTKDDFLQMALDAVSKHLSINKVPDLLQVRIAQEAIPQYDVGHASKLQQIKALLPKRIVLLGSSFQGVSVNDCIAQASEHAFLPDCKKMTGQPEST